MGYKVKHWREKRGLTQEELAVKSGVSRGTIHALETDDAKCTTTTTLKKLAAALEIGIDDLFFAQSV